MFCGLSSCVGDCVQGSQVQVVVVMNGGWEREREMNCFLTDHRIIYLKKFIF